MRCGGLLAGLHKKTIAYDLNQRPHGGGPSCAPMERRCADFCGGKTPRGSGKPAVKELTPDMALVVGCNYDLHHVRLGQDRRPA